MPRTESSDDDREIVELFRRVALEVVPTLNPNEIEPESQLVALQADSLALMEMLAELEDALGIRLQEADLVALRTVQDVVSLCSGARSHARR